jgi:hypothetical protein
MISEKKLLRRRVLLLLTLSLTWAVLGCRLVNNLVVPPTPEPTFTPLLPSTTTLKFSPEKLPEAQAGQAYSAIITIADNLTPIASAQIKDGELPPKLVLQLNQKDNTVEISGTPLQAGEYTFTLFIGCFGTMVSGQEGQQQYTLIVK